LGNSLLRKKFGAARDEVTVEWRRLHTEELYDLYSVSNIIRVIKSRRMRWAGHVERRGEGERRGAHSVVVGKHEGRRQLGRRRWENNIKKGFQETE